LQTEGKVEIEISYATAFARQFGQRLLLDPVVYVEMLFEKRALLLDLGDITFLPPRKIHRIEHLFLSRTCI
jgi:hypothetical protein